MAATAELFDVYGPDRKPTGEQKTKDQIFADGDYRQVVHIWVVNDEGDVLCQRRAEQGKGLWDGLWDVTVGGGVDAGEPPIRAAIREAREELALFLDEDDLEEAGTFDTTKPIPEREITSHEFSRTYVHFSGSEEVGPLSLQEEEVADVMWVPLGQVGVSGFYEWVPHPDSYYDGVRDFIEANS